MNLSSDRAQKIRQKIVETLSDYDLLRDQDRLMVCVSGGKDSSVLLALLAEIQRRAPFHFDLAAVILDQKQPGFEVSEFRTWVEEKIQIPLTILEEDTFSIVKEKTDSKTYCGLCSRLRRGILYNYAAANGFNKMALGHHRDDAIETLLLNLFYSGQLQAMPPIFRSDDGRNLVIRPLLAVGEREIAELASEWHIPIIPCNLCGSQEGLKRARMKQLLADMEREIPFVRQSLAKAVTNVRPSHLADPRIWNFESV